MKDIRHECLEAHILHASNVFCPLEVFRSFVCTALSGVIYEIFSNLAVLDIRSRLKKEAG